MCVFKTLGNYCPERLKKPVNLFKLLLHREI